MNDEDRKYKLKLEELLMTLVGYCRADKMEEKSILYRNLMNEANEVVIGVVE